MVMELEIFAIIKGDDESLEEGTLEALAGRGELMAYRHPGVWECMDTQRDRSRLEALWESGEAPWKLW